MRGWWSSVSSDSPGHRLRRLAGELTRHRRALTRIATEVGEALELLSEREPSTLEVRGAGALVHDFYSGAEKAFEHIATTMDGGLPEGASWHRRLLESMECEIEAVRPAVLSPATAGDLEEYLRFRHLFRNLYGFELDWPRIEPLLSGIAAVHEGLERDLEAFQRALAGIATR